MPGMKVCQYCDYKGLVYSNSDSGKIVAEDDEGGILSGIDDEAISIDYLDGAWYLTYSDAPDENGDMVFRSIGCPINYCPNCGRRLQGKKVE